MKKLINTIHLPLWVLLAGGLGLLLRVWLMASGIDQKGFILTGHFAAIALFLLVIAVVAVLFWLTKDLLEATKYSFNFPASRVSGYGSFVAAAGIFICSFIEIFTASDAFETVVAVLGMASTLLLFLNGYHRLRGTAPSVLIHIGICVFLMVRLICYYRHWSSDPQILDYCFQLVATACLMLASYQRASFDADNGDRRPYAFFSLATIFFSCLSLIGWDNVLFFLAVIAWQVTDLCSLIPLALEDILVDEEEEIEW